MLNIETDGIIDLPEFEKLSWGYRYPIGRLQMGQCRDIFITCDSPIQLSIEGVDIQSVDGSLDIVDRQRAALGIMQCHQLAVISTEKANTLLNTILGEMTESGVIEDLNGQVREAIQPDAYRKWGRHYLPSLFLAHWTQHCNNFLDKGIQKYGGTTFQMVRDNLDEVFNNMAAPKPTHRERVVERCRTAGRPAPARTSTMRSYNTSDGPCFPGPCQVHMQDGSKKMVQDIVKGDVVQTSTGSAKVRCVLKTICKNSICELVRLGQLIVTPWHPIRRNKWLFPIQLKESETLPCEYVYSFLLEENAVSMIIEGEECITLAHGIEDDAIARHPFYGTQEIITHMKSLEGYQEGLITIHGVKRNVDTNLVCGLI